MTKSSVYYWPPSTVDGLTNGIALNQSPTVGSQLDLVANTPNGVFSYVNVLTPNTTTSGTSTDIIRSISITSPDDNTGITFIISGIGTPINPPPGDGNPTGLVYPIIENLTGLNANTVTSANIYTVINSITVTLTNPDVPAEATNISVGYGPNGIINYIRRDNNRDVASVYGDTYQLHFINNDTLVANTYVSLNTPETPNIYGGTDSYGLINGTQVSFIPAQIIDQNVNTDIVNSPPFGFSVFWVQISSCTVDSMFLTILQPGTSSR